MGRVLRALEANKLEKQTIVIFFSDNGGLCTRPLKGNGKRRANTRIGPGCNLPLRSGKGWLYEGGVREPALAASRGFSTACNRSSREHGVGESAGFRDRARRLNAGISEDTASSGNDARVRKTALAASQGFSTAC